ncbi:Cof-type HAD-IIB family hydrolase [Vibrio hepatarius]|uniref:Cof-type HAD-IIB family hydrolase n=1 Tax=Vibrio hepatarius TaxID=171383 RepID=UPI001C087649|nr:Cof-type HAD-IIB family hydrolase [Vibrio hepatarius]MBU2899326.1 Cof-type HAD-IIB family hydrolase [Vibrio hepatarius]
MSLMDIKFVASDMDGTLLNENGDLNPEFFEIFSQLEQKNITFAAASGRQYYSLRETFYPIKDRIVFIAENGTLVMYQDRELYCCTIGADSIKDIIELAREITGAHVVLCGKRSAYIETQDPQAIEEISHYYHRCQSVDDLLNVKDEFIKVAICHFNGTQECVFPTINSHFGTTHQVVVSAKIWLDVMNINASKGAAIKYLQQTLGFTHQQTMSFGDYLNDLEMLEESYYSYAMGNAHNKIKQIARFTAPSNYEDGVLKILKQIL